MTKTITHEVTFSASPNEVYETLMDPTKHSKFTGAPAMIERKPGGRFSYGEVLSGEIIELRQDVRIVLSWRAEDWPKSHYSQVIFTLTPLADGRRTQLSLVHTGVPEDKFDEINNGWQEFYWTKMAAFFREEKVAVVRRFTEGFTKMENLNIVDELFTPDFVLHVPGITLPPGPASWKALGKAFFMAFSEVQVFVEDTLVEGDRVAERHRTLAVHTGEFNGVPATGRKVYLTENHIYRIKEGKIAEEWSEVSLHDLMAQITSRRAVAA